MTLKFRYKRLFVHFLNRVSSPKIIILPHLIASDVAEKIFRKGVRFEVTDFDRNIIEIRVIGLLQVRRTIAPAQTSLCRRRVSGFVKLKWFYFRRKLNS